MGRRLEAYFISSRPSQRQVAVMGEREGGEGIQLPGLRLNVWKRAVEWVDSPLDRYM